MHLVENVERRREAAGADESRLAYVTQTTLSVDDARAIVDALKARFPLIVGPKKDDICYATQNRQDAVKQTGGAGATWSSSSARQTARIPTACAKWQRIAVSMPTWWMAPTKSGRNGLFGKRHVGVTAGAFGTGQ
jgi:4-hydroxy-3-methylbut-2-enyl diphosphate reductase